MPTKLPPKHPPVTRPTVATAPVLTEDGLCSACQVRAVVAGQSEYKVCPRCYALLWHVDHEAEQRAAREAERERLRNVGR